jgi:hypothetical protein
LRVLRFGRGFSGASLKAGHAINALFKPFGGFD